MAVQADTLPAAARFEPGADLLAQLAQAPRPRSTGARTRSTKTSWGCACSALYGLKGAAAYMEHARVLDQQDAGSPPNSIASPAGSARIPAIWILFKCAMDIGLLNFKIMECWISVKPPPSAT